MTVATKPRRCDASMGLYQLGWLLVKLGLT